MICLLTQAELRKLRYLRLLQLQLAILALRAENDGNV
jgi:hypothetical protein